MTRATRVGWFGLAILLGTPGLGAGQTRTDTPASQVLFDSGKEGYKRYRIPALVTTAKGSVLAFAEGRKDGGGLTGDIDIVLKRSLDSGQTWPALTVVADDGPHTLGNPCPVLDRKDGTLWLALTRSHGEDTEDGIVAGKSRETTRVVLTWSRDDGQTWAPLRDITAAVKAPDWTWYGTGPGVGVQLKSGRLLIPCYHAEAATKTYRSHMIYSDDHGLTWRRSEAIGTDCTECQVAERADGGLVLSARTIKGKPERTTAVSKDGGLTWSKPERDPKLYDPSCQASLIRLTTGDQNQPRWLYCHPAGPDGRRNLTVRLSADEGRVWSDGKRLRAGDSQYSCLSPLPDGRIGCLYDCWVDGNYRLFFVRFDLAWLTAKPD